MFQPKNIVIIRTDRIGEVLLSTVSVDVIKKHFPGAKITFVTSNYARPIVEDKKDVSEIITFDTVGKDRKLLDAAFLASILRKKRFDVSIALNPHKVLHLACFLAGIPYRIGYDRKWGFLLNRRIRDERDKGIKHEIEYTMDLLRLLGIEEKNLAPSLSLNNEASYSVNKLLEEKNVGLEKSLIAIHPSCSNPLKRWPQEKYVELICKILKELDSEVVLIGANKENGLIKKVKEKSSRDILDLTASLSLKELTAILAKCSLFIGSDTGPMHIAAALGVPVIALFMQVISNPVRWRPWGNGHVVFHETQNCALKSNNSYPYDYRCLQEITPDIVFGAVKEALMRVKELGS